MCRAGDIIVIKNYKSQGRMIARHSFVVISDEGGKIYGMDYDLVCNVMSSFHSEDHRASKLRFSGNLEYVADEENVSGGHNIGGFIKVDQLYYFNKDTIDFYVIGSVSPLLFARLKELTSSLDHIEDITDNLRSDT